MLDDSTQAIEMLNTRNSYMNQKSITIFINKKYSKPSRKVYSTNKTDAYHIDDIWSLDILNLKDFCPENYRNYRYILVIIEKFSKFSWTIALKNKNAQKLENFFEVIRITSKRNPK